MATVRAGLAALRFWPFPREPVAEAAGSFHRFYFASLRETSVDGACTLGVLVMI